MSFTKVFETWAPRESVWSDWVKPVVFSHMPYAWVSEPMLAKWPPADVAMPEAMKGAAIVVDIPGDASAAMGVALARIGYRPVPLFNGAPDEKEPVMNEEGSLLFCRPVCIDVWPIMRTLWRGTWLLSEARLPAEAPPAFLLDSRRRGGTKAAGPGGFDNRWISFPTDFPSARILQERGIAHVVVVTADRTTPEPDLTHTLMRWQEAGIEILIMQMGVDASPRAIAVKAPDMFRMAIYRFAQLFGLKRNVLGGFGGMLAETGSAG